MCMQKKTQKRQMLWHGLQMVVESCCKGVIMKTVLCFGDSNTYGANPNLDDGMPRWPRDVRWTGVLQNLLGPEYYVIEEGYNGRTIGFHDARDPYRCGFDAVVPILGTHSPVDLVIVMLGTNDIQSHYSATPKTIASFLEVLIHKMKNYCTDTAKAVPEILVVSPILIGDKIAESVYWTLDESAPQKSRELSKLFQIVAQRNACEFFDAATVACPGADELHMDKDSHAALAKALCEKVKTILA